MRARPSLGLALLHLGRIERDAGNPAGEAMIEEALAIAERIQDERMLLYARTLRAVVASESGDVETYTVDFETDEESGPDPATSPGPP